MFGTQVQADFELSPLLKGLKIGTVQSEICMFEDVTVAVKGETIRTSHGEYIVSTDTFNFPEDAETEDIDGREGFRLSRTLNIPKKLRLCLQTCEERNIRIRHQLKFTVLLNNPDGHVSEVCPSIPSPEVP